MEMLKKIQVNIMFREALEQMLVYAKFMKELLSWKKFKCDEIIALDEECSAIIQRKLAPKLIDTCKFIIPCFIVSLAISNPLCDLRASVNLISMSTMRKLKYGELKSTHMTLTLADKSIRFPYGILEDVLVRFDDLVFPAYFVILDMSEDSETPLILKRSFLATSKALIDVAID